MREWAGCRVRREGQEEVLRVQGGEEILRKLKKHYSFRPKKSAKEGSSGAAPVGGAPRRRLARAGEVSRAAPRSLAGPPRAAALERKRHFMEVALLVAAWCSQRYSSWPGWPSSPTALVRGRPWPTSGYRRRWADGEDLAAVGERPRRPPGSGRHRKGGCGGGPVLLLAFVAGIGANLARGRRPERHRFLGQLHSEPDGRRPSRDGVLAVVAGFVVWRGYGGAGASRALAPGPL